MQMQTLKWVIKEKRKERRKVERQPVWGRQGTNHLLVWKILDSFILIKHPSYLFMCIVSYKQVVDDERGFMEEFQLEWKQALVGTK